MEVLYSKDGRVKEPNHWLTEVRIFGGVGFVRYRVGLVLLLMLLVQPGCKQSGYGGFALMRSTESLVVDYLTEKYEQPSNNMWEDGKLYFLPDSGLELLGHQADLNLSVYKTSLWFIHWVPEKLPVLVWTVRSLGEMQIGVLEGPSEIAEKFPDLLKEVVFKDRKRRREFALLLAKMVVVLEPRRPSGEPAVTSEGDCEWAECAGTSQGKRRRIVAACFSGRGRLERIIVPPRELSLDSISSPAEVPAAE